MDQIEVERINVLTRDTYYQAIQALHEGLPPPTTDDPEELARRDNVAMAEVTSMAPGNAEEVMLAVLVVTAGAHAVDTFRAPRGGSQDAAKNRAQFASMMRQATGARSLLLRVQAARLKREANNPAADAAAWIEHIGLTHMATALGRPWAGRVAEEPDQGVGADFPATQSGQDFEMESRSTYNETTVRPGSAASPADDAPDSLPAGQNASRSETLYEITCNETSVRRGDPVFAANAAPAPASRPWPLSRPEPPPETIVAQRPRPYIDGLPQAAPR
jgi:hypothetical protein